MRNHKFTVDRPGFVQRVNLQLIVPLGNASRGLFKKLWGKMRPVRPQLGSPAPLHGSYVRQRVSSPSYSYHGVQYTRLSTLMDVDYFRGSMNPDGLDFDTLKVLNPDPSTSGPGSEESQSTRVTSVATVGTLCSPAAVDAFPPRLPDLGFMSKPDSSFSFMMATAFRKLKSSVSSDSWRVSRSEHNDPVSLPQCQYMVNVDQPPLPSLLRETYMSRLAGELVATLPCPPIPIPRRKKRDLAGARSSSLDSLSTRWTNTVQRGCWPPLAGDLCFKSCCSPHGPSRQWLDINQRSGDEFWNKQSHLAAYLAVLEHRPAHLPMPCPSDATTTRTAYDPSTIAVCSRSSLSSAKIPRSGHFHRNAHPCPQNWRRFDPIACGTDDFAVIIVRGLLAQDHRQLRGKFWSWT